jgi:glycosyltransferase involved in cell wall biosynthesis
MNILMVTPHSPYPPVSGGRIREWELLNFLAARHTLTLVSFFNTEQEQQGRPELERVCRRVIFCKYLEKPLPAAMKLHRDLPWNLYSYHLPEMRMALERVEPHRFDVVLLETLFLACYRELLPARAVLAEYDIVSQIYKQYAQLWQTRTGAAEVAQARAFWKATALSTEAYENRMWSQFSLRTTVSVKDKAEMDRRCSQGKTIVIENGVNTGTNELLQNDGARTVLLMGTLSYVPNAEAAISLARTIMPLVWRVDPTICLCIAGSNPPAPVLALATDPRIEIQPNPTDMKRIAERAAISVVPLRIGGGTRLKILESLAWGMPVVSTTLGCEGLDVVDGETIVIRDEPQAFADGIVELMTDAARRNKLRCQGRQLVERRYDWQGIFPQLEEALESLSEESVHSM